jgi:hypothetical protein
MRKENDPVSQIEQLLDELESFAEKSPWYLPGKIAIRDEDFFRISQRIRELLPSELAEAREMLEKRDLILKNAQEEHRRIIDAAEKRLDDLTSDEQVVIVAKQRAEQVLQNARFEAEALKRDALLYTGELLEDMERQFKQTLEAVHKGREFILAEINQAVGENLAGVEASQTATLPQAPLPGEEPG